MTQPYSQFPFGLSKVESYEDTCLRYAAEAPMLSEKDPLPSSLPFRHPVLQRLEGTFPVQDAIPAWWQECVDALAQECPCIEPLLREMSREEFRRGSIEQARWKTWRALPCQHAGEQHAVSCWRQYGPSLHWIMEKVLPADEQKKTWMDQFVSRGSKDVPQDLDLVLTSAPAWWLNMSNGRGWYSCMGSGDNRDPRMLGNWYDTGVLLAALVQREADCWSPESLIARTTVRLVWDRYGFRDEDGALPVLPPARRLAVGRVYHNDLTSAYNLLVQLAQLFEARGHGWGCIVGTNTAQYARSGLLGPVRVEGAARRALGVVFWRPEDIEAPYLDGEAYYRELDQREQDGFWAYPSLSLHPCRLHSPLETEALTATDTIVTAASSQSAPGEEAVL